jgi:iron complex transport system substrate-binding protein
MAAAIALAACGDDDKTAGSSSTGAAEESAYPVTMRSKHGSATIAQRPKRVVTLDNQATDDALALGVVPVGIAEVTYVPGGKQAWTKQALRGKPAPELINTDSGIPYERVAALRPDLILATNTFALEEKSAYDRLRRIAPTVHFAKSSLSDSWQDVMRRVGQALGQEDRAKELVAEAEGGLAAVRERTPEFEGKTVNLFNGDPSGLYTINEPTDYAIRFLADLGLRLSPRVAALGAPGGAHGGESGRAVISPERYDVLDSDLLIGTSISPKALTKLESDTLFKRIGAVQDGRYVSLTIGDGTSMAFPSLLSVRYATTQVLPRLEQAITRGGGS